MTKESIENRINALTPNARKLLLAKVKEIVDLKTSQSANNSRQHILAYVQGSEGFSVDRLKQDLKKNLPDYMMPSKIIPIATMPLLPNGKIDRKQLNKITESKVTPVPVNVKSTSRVTLDKVEQKLVAIWEETLGFSPVHIDDNFFEIGGDSILSIQIIAKARKANIVLQANDIFEYQTIAELALFAKETVQNGTSVEEKLLKIWEETLGFSPIHRDDNFFEIGGDSILSIQIIAKARKEGLILKANDLFENQTVGELSLLAKTEIEEKNTDILQGIVPLSPIQHWFFDVFKNAPHYWNQGIRIDNLPTSSERQIREVCDYLVMQHDMLRSRFTQKDNEWIQEISPPEQIRALNYVDLSGIATEQHEAIVLEEMHRIQYQFDLTKGSLFKCIYFGGSGSSNDFCIFIGHHLLVDIVSWQIIFDDFKTALNEVHAGKAISRDTKTSSFKDWTDYLRTYAENLTSKELMFWQSQLTAVPALPFDKENPRFILDKDVVQVDFSFDAATSKALVEANQALNTKTEELLIAAFIDAIGTWCGHKKIAVGFERHGRETTGSQLDVSKTVGWFTSYFPLQFEFQPNNSIDHQIIAVKEKLRSIPNGGIGFGGLRYITKVFGDIASPEIVFNFSGTQLASQSNKAAKITWLNKNLRDPRSEFDYKLEINIGFVNDILKGTFSFGKNVHHAKTINTLISDFKNRIQVICEYCNQAEKGRYTPSDFPEIEISQDDLDSLLDSLS